MAKVAKIASKNSPTQRGKAVAALYEGKPVTKVVLHSRNGGRKNVAGYAAFKDAAASASANLIITKANGDRLSWNEVSSSGQK